MGKPREIDLHLQAFRRNTSGMSPEAMLNVSIERMRSALDEAISNGEKEIRFIHGRGKGALRERVYQELQTYAREGEIISFEPSFFNPDIVVVRIRY
ncbi:Smr domain-containing protein [Anseongella ginsenosidimutans]|uniref:Smr domain-containing protein n=1 Tax=Anseongella ginsenosidimutans TaxID=496056 RepID=A0A4R3KWW4_9SPHI|nr:Smr/MutS family protein [Anseongella ginsenosidimutans]QEC51857.1 Smr/MutS family protein [Anseongella ginsenosidimutans]TCS89236.1 Smr domain-containing protein [Anseongella ginsenosidimutans]